MTDSEPELGHFFWSQGFALAQQERYSEAAEQFAKAVYHCPNLAKAHLSLGMALRDQGLPDEAIPHLRRAIDLRPNYAEAHCELAYVLLMLGQWEEAWQQHEWRFFIRAFLQQNLPAILPLLIRKPHFMPIQPWRSAPHLAQLDRRLQA